MIRFEPLLLLCTAAAALAQAPQGAAPARVPGPNPLSPRREVRVQPVPKAVLPPAKDLVNTAQSGAARPRKLLKTMPLVQLTSAEDTSVSSRKATPQGHWILLYRTENCLPCDRLMNGMAGNGDSPQATLQQLTVVVAKPHPAATAAPGKQHAFQAAAPQAKADNMTVSAQRSALIALRAKFPALDKAQWKYDGKGQVSEVLKPAGVPMMYGMDGDHIVWQAAGIPGGITATQQRVASWLSTKSAADLAAASNAAPMSTNP